MVNPTLISRRKSTSGPAIKIPDNYSVHRGPVKPPLNSATKKIINNFYHLTHEATQTQQRRQRQTKKPVSLSPSPTLVDKATDTDDLSRGRAKSTYEPSEDARVFIRVKKSFLLKLIKRCKEQSTQLDEVRKLIRFNN